MNLDERFMNIEMAIANQQKIIDEFNEVLIKQGNMIDLLLKENKYLINMFNDAGIKPQSEETPPPHY